RSTSGRGEPVTLVERLDECVAAAGSLLCVGLDPADDADAAAAERRCLAILEATLSEAAAVKPNLAFFEQFGAAGYAVLERLRARVPADRLLILDGLGLRWDPGGLVGFVVGATDPAAIAGIRAAAPHAPLLLPGVGAQGGDLEAAVRAGLDRDGGGLLLSVSRGIAAAPEGPARA